MFPYHHLLAAVLLTTPPEAAPPPVSPEEFAALRPTVQALAVEWEILDPREVRHILVRPEDFSENLLLLRQRYADLADAPLLCDGLRFPDRATVSDLLAFNRAYRQQIDVRGPTSADAAEHRAALRETDELYQVWDTVRDARCEYYYVTVRRQALKKLRETLGDEAYYRGELPPFVPLWRFREVD
jgi:hypothetical protein